MDRALATTGGRELGVTHAYQLGGCFRGLVGRLGVGGIVVLTGWCVRFGSNCENKCPVCEHGSCNSGTSGTGLCVCDVG